MNPQMVVRIVANLAELKKNLAEGVSSITTTTSAMNKLASSLDGSKLEQRAHNIVAAVNQVGGATKLTDAEAKRLLLTLDAWIAKAQRLGKEVPADILKTRDALVRTNDEAGKMPAKFTGISSGLSSLAAAFGVTFSIGALVGFGRELLRMGDEIQKMADKTSLSTDEVQRLSFVADQTGVSIEGIVGAVQNLQQRLGTGDEGAVGALKSLGINARDFLALNPYDQFMKISEAVGKIEDPTRRAAVMAEVFGKSWKEIGPAVIANVKGIADAAPVMSQKTVKALDEAGDALSKFSLTVKVAAAEFYLYLGRAFDLAIARTYTYIAELQESLAGVYRVLAKIPGSSKVFTTLDSDIKGLTESAKWYRDAAAGMAQQTEQVAVKARAAVVPMEALTTAKTRATSAAKTAKTAVDAETEAMARLNKIIKEQIALLPRLKTNFAELNLGAGMTPQIAFVPRTSLASDLVRRLNEEYAHLMGSDAGTQVLNEATAKALIKAGIFAGGKGGEAAADEFGNKWVKSFATITRHLDSLAGHFDNVFGQILSAAADVTNALSVMFDPTASTFDKVTAGIELAISLGKKLVSLFTDEVAEKVNDLRDEFLLTFGPGGTGIGSGFATLAAQLHELGAVGDELFQRLINAKKVEEFESAVDAVNAALDRAFAARPENMAAAAGFQTREQLQAYADEARKIYEYVRDSGLYTAEVVQQAWERSQAAMVAAGNASTVATKKLSDELVKLTEQRDGLVASIANEAHEEVMGVIEAETRARIAQIEQEMAAKEEQINQAQAAAEQATQDIKDQATEVNDHIRRLFSDPIRIPIRWEMPELPEGPSGEGGFAHGTPGLTYSDFGAVTPTYLHGREAVIPEGRVGELAAQIASAMGGSRPSGRTMVPIIVQVDRRNLLEIVAEGVLQ